VQKRKEREELAVAFSHLKSLADRYVGKGGTRESVKEWKRQGKGRRSKEGQARIENKFYLSNKSFSVFSEAENSQDSLNYFEKRKIFGACQKALTWLHYHPLDDHVVTVTKDQVGKGCLRSEVLELGAWEGWGGLETGLGD
jgi:hypothetical protein